MSTTAIGLSVVAVLAAYLCGSVWRRHHAAAARQRAMNREWPGRAIDASALLPGIEQLRGNYLLAVRSRPRHSPYHNGLIAAAQRAVAHLSYFHLTNAGDPDSTADDARTGP